MKRGISMQKFNNETEFIFSNEFIGFTTVPNYILNDKKISYKALGIYVQILQFQNSPDHKVYIKTLSTLKKDGRDGVSSGIKELLDAGYLSREQLKDDKGRMNGHRYTVFMKPVKPCEIDVPPVNGFSVNGQSDNGKSDNGESVPNKTIPKKKISKKKIKSVSPSEKERETDVNLDIRNQIEEQIDAETLRQEMDPRFVDELINNICNMYESDSIKIGKSNITQRRVRENIRQLKQYHIEHVIRQYNDTSSSTKIVNVKGYLQTCIYNSIYEATARIENDVRVNGLIL